jgi:2TM domain
LAHLAPRRTRRRRQAFATGYSSSSAVSLDLRAKGGNVMSVSTNDALAEARRYVRRKRIFYMVLGIWIALSLMWFVIDMTDDSSSVWFYWPMLGTGIAVAITGIVLLGIGGLFGANWERREIDKYLRRSGNEPGP